MTRMAILLTTISLLGAAPVSEYTSNSAIASAVTAYQQVDNPALVRAIWIPRQLGTLPAESFPEATAIPPGMTRRQAEAWYVRTNAERIRTEALDVVSKVANEVVSHSSLVYSPQAAVETDDGLVMSSPISTYGDLVLLDITALSGGDAQRAETILNAWEGFVQADWVFHNFIDTGGKRIVENRPSLSADMKLLEKLTGSQVPVVYWRQFVVQSNQAREDLHGLYYLFQGYRVGGSRSDWLTDHGAFAATARKLGGDRGTIIFRRGPTNKAGSVRWFRQLTGLDRIAFSTFDLDEKHEHDADFNPRLNPLGHKHDAEEHLAFARNGMLHGMLSNAGGEIQSSAPDTVARDNTAPHNTILEAGHSCYRCHGSSAGFQPLRNDYASQYTPESALTVIADENFTDQDKFLQDLTRTFFGGREAHILPVIEARTTYNVACRQATGGRRDATEANALFSEVFADYFSFVTPAEAAALLGQEEFDVPLPNLASGPIVREHAAIGALRDGHSVTWSEWQLVYATCAERLALQEQTQ